MYLELKLLIVFTLQQFVFKFMTDTHNGYMPAEYAKGKSIYTRGKERFRLGTDNKQQGATRTVRA